MTNYAFNHAKEKEKLIAKGLKANLALFKKLEVIKKPNGGLYYKLFFNVFDDAFEINQYGYRSKVLMFNAHFNNGPIGKSKFYESLQNNDLVELFYTVNESNGKAFYNLYTLHFKNHEADRNNNDLPALINEDNQKNFAPEYEEILELPF